MLLYVDKKKLKRRKIKIISITLSCILILIANIIHFRTALHQTDQSLTAYTPLQTTQNWYNGADVVTVFSAHKQIKAILIPQNTNRENTLTIALALSRLPAGKTILTFTEDVSPKNYLQTLSGLFISPEENKTQENVIITTDINQIIPLINELKLTPAALNYRQTANLRTNERLNSFINRHFPPEPQPLGIQEKQQQALEQFAQKYRSDLLKLIQSSENSIAFINKSLLLQHLAVCISSKDKTVCNATAGYSLQKNLHTALAGLHSQTPQKIFLLTTPEEIPFNTVLEKDDGALLRYGTKEAFILPQKKAQNPNNTNIYAYLKQQAGLNPDYHSPDMKFYKFKTTEIDINDNI